MIRHARKKFEVQVVVEADQETEEICSELLSTECRRGRTVEQPGRDMNMVKSS
jgi:hypothetical protein